jgi:UTP--glucose-1-phosphate uridylyltransferase
MAGLDAAERKMRDEGLPDAAIAAFRRLYRQLAAGERGFLATDELEPVADIPALDDLADGPSPMDAVAVLKLNGGLGTSMGLDQPKSLIPVRGELTFLDVIARQVLAARGRHEARLPLVLMHSFATREQSLGHLARYPDLPADVPLDFLQGREPKLRADDLGPVEWPAQPHLEWCPPGHGDLYTAIATSGVLDALRERGYRYAFVSNSDNLGAVVEPRIPAWMAEHDVPFVMEVVAGTAADRKGGHIARREGRLVLRETAQTPPDDADSFGDFRRWRFYNTNNLWLDLDALAALLAEREGDLGLPLIVNRKTVDPADKSSPAVLQLETAMGAALGVIPGARALEVPRRRFVPVKTTDDLLVVRSDACVLDPDDARLEPRGGWPLVALDAAYFKLLGDFEQRFAAGPPSLARCERLVVRGDVSFGRDVVVEGDVELDGPASVPDGAVLSAGSGPAGHG